MKKLLLIILILLPCELGAQEGCGEWMKPKATPGMDVIDGSVVRTYAFEYESWDKIDSVWVPKPCPDTVEIKTSSTPLATVSCCDLKITRWYWRTDGGLDSSMIDIQETISGAFMGRYKFRKTSDRVWEWGEISVPDTVAYPEFIKQEQKTSN